jgi:PHD/YefM family antitoxin component YafN of YafNO toxin-antitoxin module
MYKSLVHVQGFIMPPVFLSISSARQKFFALFETVTGHRSRKVVITSRGSANRAVLIGEAYFNDLESAAKRLQEIESGKAAPASAFKLVGSGRIAAGGGDPVTDLRADEHALTDKKLASLGK